MKGDNVLQQKGDVAVVIDYDNLFYSIRNNYEAFPNLEEILDAAGQFGRVASSHAFGDWIFHAQSIPFLFRAGVQPVFCPLSHSDPKYSSRAKSSVDATICVHTMKNFYSNRNLHTLVLVSGDRDYIPLVIEIRQMGHKVVIIGVGKALSSDLTEVADTTVLYEDIVNDLNPREGLDIPQRVKGTADPYPILIEEIKLARENRKPTVLAYLKLRLKARIEGFDETKLADSSGRRFKKFKEFIIDAVNRGMIKVFTTGTVSEIFLPDEDPENVSYSADSSPEFLIPPEDYVEMIEDVLNKSGKSMAYTNIVIGLTARKRCGELSVSNKDVQMYLKSAIHYGILIGKKEGTVTRYRIAEKWRDILYNINGI